MLWGFVKKVVIADRLSLFVNPVYNSVATSSSAQIFVATIFFAFQIYCDFSGYSDIAKGSARVLGFSLVDNFKRPYFSQSFDEFWKRWHISLSRWFKDYMYIPLGGNRVSKLRGYFNVFFVFLVSGLWHGASWTFVIWGALHGLYLIVERLLKPFVSSIGNWFSEKYILALSLCRMIMTFAFVTFAWVFFRSNTFADSIIVVQKLFTFSPSLLASVFSIPVVFSALLIVMLLLVEGVDEYILKSSKNEHSLWTRILASPTAVRWTCYYSLLFLILLLGVFTQNEFIYFQF
jgi:D-alanyl-lipoteichoic acid acyltransferase DltB (MBOAT superfamily)